MKVGMMKSSAAQSNQAHTWRNPQCTPATPKGNVTVTRWKETDRSTTRTTTHSRLHLLLLSSVGSSLFAYGGRGGHSDLELPRQLPSSGGGSFKRSPPAQHHHFSLQLRVFPFFPLPTPEPCLQLPPVSFFFLHKFLISSSSFIARAP